MERVRAGTKYIVCIYIELSVVRDLVISEGFCGTRWGEKGSNEYIHDRFVELIQSSLPLILLSVSIRSAMPALVDVTHFWQSHHFAGPLSSTDLIEYSMGSPKSHAVTL